MLTKLKEKYPSKISDFNLWFDSFKVGLNWENFFDGVNVELQALPIFIQFAIFKKYFLINKISIDTREYLYKTNEYLFSYRIKYDKTYDVRGDFSTDEEAMKSVIIRAFEVLEELS